MAKTTWASSLIFTEVVLELSVTFVSLVSWETAALVHWSQQQTTTQDIEPSGAAYEDGDDVDRKEVKQKAAFSLNIFALTAPGWCFWTEFVFWNVIIGQNCLNMVIDESLAFMRAASSKDSDRRAVLIHSNSLLGPGSKGKEWGSQHITLWMYQLDMLDPLIMIGTLHLNKDPLLWK